jgi:hypothetical protein
MTSTAVSITGEHIGPAEMKSSDSAESATNIGTRMSETRDFETDLSHEGDA